MIYLQLFWSFFQIGLLSFGGGYVTTPLIQHQVVDLHHWLSMKEFADVITISQMTPGPISINSATFVGTRIAGLPGAIIATLGCIVPSCVIVLTLAYFYYRYRQLSLVQGVLSGLRPAMIGMIASAGLTLVILAFWNGKGITTGLKEMDDVLFILFFLSLFILRKFKMNPITIIIVSGFLGGVIYPLL